MKIITIGLRLLGLLSLIYSSYALALTDALPEVKKTNQDHTAYINTQNPNYTLSPASQKKLVHQYVEHFFAPWTGEERILNTWQVQVIQKNIVKLFQQHPGYAQNNQLHTAEWVNQIAENMNLAGFPSLNLPAITVHSTSARLLPTIEPSYSSLNMLHPSHGVDHIQASFIPANTPLLVMHISRDGAWYLVLTPQFAGWIPNHDLAFVNQAFMDQWKKNHSYVVAVSDDKSIFDMKNIVRAKTRIGMLYPLVKSNDKSYFVLTAMSDPNQKAIIKTGMFKKDYGRPFPMPLSSKNLAWMANQMVGMSYAAGDAYRYRDGSSTLMNLLSPFGIWLPRNPTEQVRTGKFVDFSKLKPEEKEIQIQQKAVPFFTLLHTPNHVMLYLGKIDGVPYVFQNKAGFITEDAKGNVNKAILGGAYITPLNFKLENATLKNPAINEIDGMILLVSKDQLHIQQITS
ncbi:MAG: SH3 domain-containing protein [Proteobacteria bacterium]|nr:SH3 domain-containing protein [Pseudomonadota bacterium]